MMQLKEPEQFSYINAEIIGKTTIELRRYFTLNVGKNDSVKVGMAVRSDAGLVGVIVGASDSYSLVELIVNRNIRIASKIQRNKIVGIIYWEGSRNFFKAAVPSPEAAASTWPKSMVIPAPL